MEFSLQDLKPKWRGYTFIDFEEFINIPGVELSEVTFDEVHSISLGSVGFLLGRAQQPEVAAALVIVAYAFPEEEDAPIGMKTVTQESWYFSISIMFFYIIGAATRP